MKTAAVRKWRVVVVSMLVVLFTAACDLPPTLLYDLNHNIWREYASGNEKQMLIQNGERPRWIPGTKTHFAYIERLGGSPNVKLWVAEDDGANPVALTGFEIKSEYSWSPDGQWIAVAHSKDGNYEIYKIKVDGTQQVRLTNNYYTDQYPRWSPKGDKIAFVSTRGGHQDIYVMNADGTGEKKLSEASHIGDDETPAWAWDGTEIVYAAKRGTHIELKIVNVNTGQIKQITNGGLNILPIYEAKYILYLTILGQSNTLKRYDPSTGTTSTLHKCLSYTSADPLTANAAYAFMNCQHTAAGPSSIIRVQHSTGEAADIGFGRNPDVW